MKYQVVITKIETDVPFKDKDYQVVGKNEDGENKYEYVYFDSTKDVKTEVVDITVDELDIKEVVKTVYRLGE